LPLAPWTAKHRPSSVIHGRDKAAVVPLLQLFAPGLPEPRIADVTFKTGVMWKGMPVQPEERTDINPNLPNLTRVCDCRALPEEWAGRFDVVVLDLPHRSEAGKTAKNRDRYGLDTADIAHTPNVIHLFEPALREAKRVLQPKGIVLAKMANMVHRGPMHWQCDAMRAAGTAVGLRPCWSIIKVDPSGGERKFKGRVIHGKQIHSEWIVLRNGRRC
jgi:SAM-dependent methyltransferase